MAKPDTTEEKEKPKFSGLDYAVIKISESADEGESNTVFAGGTIGSYFIKRGQFAPVPRGVIENLKNAKKPIQIRRDLPDGQIITETKLVPRFEFTLARWINEEVYLKLKNLVKSNGRITEEEAYGV